ncbi:MAG TPA: cation acetate symporter [Mycobacteriales bacterium]|nr:cation acetate symporter [Mycobacteriales bacterium]
MSAGYGIGAVAVISTLTLALGALGLRMSRRTTSDFLVASRSVSPLTNASAIGGEYLSAASFLGVAGLILAYGVDMLWYPVGYAAGYLLLLVLVAAPLRRSGAYTIPDFAQERLQGRQIRRVASAFVVLIGWLYAVPQLQGAGLTIRTVTGAPRWVGAVLVAVLVTGAVAAGGMRSITVVQAFQYWVKLTAITVPVAFLLIAWRADGAPSASAPTPPTFARQTVTQVRSDTRIDVPVALTVTLAGRVDGQRVDGPRRLPVGSYTIGAGSRLTFPAGAAAPHLHTLRVTDNATWASPLHGVREHPLYAVWSLIIATFLGTMGLPHVLVRFYTNPDGQQARRTTLLVLVLLGSFYLMPTIYGALGRLYAPDLLLTGNTDSVVLILPSRLVPGVVGQLLGALVTAGAFAAFLSTTSGLVVSVAGVLVTDVLRGPVRSLRRATLVAGAVPLALTLAVFLRGEGLPIGEVVGLAFAVAASSFCPLLVLGIWWRGLTEAGALAGIGVGGGLAAAAVLATIAGWTPGGWPSALLAQPAAWTVPVAFAVMVGVSRATSGRRPPDVGRFMTRMHAPEQLRLRAARR